MRRRLIFNILLLVTALLLLIKPLVGFNLYHRAKLLAADEYITIIKAFSKRKQDYIYEIDQEINFQGRQSIRNVLPAFLAAFRVAYAAYSSVCTFSKVWSRMLLHKAALPAKLYLLHGRLSL